MTQDEFIEMAREVFACKHCPLPVPEDRIVAFAKKVAEKAAAKERERLTDAAMKAAEKSVDVAIALEREACLKLAEKYQDHWTIDAIRARGEA